MPASVASGTPYFVEFYESPLQGEPPFTVRLLKNGGQVAEGQVSIVYQSTDYGAQTVTWTAVGCAGEVSVRYVTIVSSNTPPVGSFDFADSTVAQGQPLSAWGWAADNEMGAPVTRVDVFIDAVDRGDAALGGDRPDVSAAYNRPEYRYSGWNWSYGTSGLSLGVHTVSITAVDNQGATTGLGAKNFTVVAGSPVTVLSVNRSAIPAGATVSLTAATTDPSGDLTSQAIDYLAPGASTWVLGTPTGNPNGSWSGSATSQNTLTRTSVLSTVGSWQFRARGRDAGGAYGAYSTVNVSVAAVTSGSDFDGDGMPDQWELQYGFDPAGASDAGADADGDGLSNSAEYFARRNPLDATEGGKFPSAASVVAKIVTPTTIYLRVNRPAWVITDPGA